MKFVHLEKCFRIQGGETSGVVFNDKYFLEGISEIFFSSFVLTQTNRIHRVSFLIPQPRLVRHRDRVLGWQGMCPIHFEHVSGSTPEISGSIPNIGKVYGMSLSVNCNSEKTIISKKRPGLARLKKHVGELASAKVLRTLKLESNSLGKWEMSKIVGNFLFKNSSWSWC